MTNFVLGQNLLSGLDFARDRRLPKYKTCISCYCRYQPLHLSQRLMQMFWTRLIPPNENNDHCLFTLEHCGREGLLRQP